MFKRISDSIRYSLREETFQQRSERMLPGALYGALVAGVYILALSIVNVISFPGLHLAVDWARLIPSLLGYGLALALAGVIVGWFTENYQGIVTGGVLMTLLILVGNLLVTLLNHSGANVVMQSVVASLPLIGAAVLAALGLRYVINRHINAQKEPPAKRRKMLAGQIGVIIFVAVFMGMLGRFDQSTVLTLQALNNTLTNGRTDPDAAARFTAAKSLPAVKDHFGTSYGLYVRPSVAFASSSDITIRFSDGYTVTCLVSTDTGSQTFFTTCSEGANFIAP